MLFRLARRGGHRLRRHARRHDTRALFPLCPRAFYFALFIGHFSAPHTKRKMHAPRLSGGDGFTYAHALDDGRARLAVLLFVDYWSAQHHIAGAFSRARARRRAMTLRADISHY